MTTMKAVRLFEFGGPDKLRYGDHPMPEVAPTDVLVKVLATSVSRWDIKYRTGEVHEFYGKSTGHHGGIHGRRAFRCRCSSAATSPAKSRRWAQA
jgi:NADPH:quinone reductase-like Zn-dependent oxidoreductase